MGRFLAGSISALLLVAGSLFWWQGQARNEAATLVARPDVPAPVTESLPRGDHDAMGRAPPKPPAADSRTREQRRFDRYDRDRDNIIARDEMLGTRARDFRKLDKDGNNLLSFEDWAVRTVDKFDGADADHDGRLTRTEFATTAPEPTHKAKCKC
ncbi:hypothetical protein BH10PSE13_BH10PSE13_26660 [soil metagenome]